MTVLMASIDLEPITGPQGIVELPDPINVMVEAHVPDRES